MRIEIPTKQCCRIDELSRRVSSDEAKAKKKRMERKVTRNNTKQKQNKKQTKNEHLSCSMFGKLYTLEPSG